MHVNIMDNIFYGRKQHTRFNVKRKQKVNVLQGACCCDMHVHFTENIVQGRKLQTRLTLKQKQ